MKVPRAGHTATLLPSGVVLIVGGVQSITSDGSYPYGGVSLATAEIYNPATGAFTLTMGSMSVERNAHTATLLANGKLLIAGGVGLGGVTSSTAELYDPMSEMFSQTAGPMHSKRERHTATLGVLTRTCHLGRFPVDNSGSLP